jgi:hypothetical protein
MDVGEWTSFPVGSLWDRMKPLGSLMTTERTNRRQEQEFMSALRRGDFTGLGKTEKE